MITKLLDFILKNITSKNSFHIDEKDKENGVYSIDVESKDIGKVIGKRGSIIRAIRNLALVTSSKNSLKTKPQIRINEKID